MPLNRLKWSKNILLINASIITSFAFGQMQKAVFPKQDSCMASKKADSIASQKDVGDVITSLFKIHKTQGADCSLEKPGKLFFSFVPAAGYTLEGGPTATIIVNASFYASDPANTNLSVFTFGGQYSLTKQLIIPVISNIWTKGNKYDLLGDWRFYNYPSLTYGLGANTSLSNSNLIDYSYIKIYQEVLRHFSSYYYIGMGYDFDDHFGITDNNDITDFEEYNKGMSKTISTGPLVHIMYDSRTNSNNPKDAVYASIIYRTNFKLLGSDQNWQYLQVEIRKYFKLSSHDVLAFWSWNEFTNGNAPYFDLPSDQWDTYSNTGRGYIQGFYRGTDMIYLEAEYRFGITHNGLLGGVIFSNAGTVTQWPGKNFEYIDPGEGVGLRIKFNKYSDVNLCIDYAVGINGSNGFFFNLGEVF